MKKQILLFLMTLLPVVTWGDDSGAINGISWFYEESTSTLTLSGAGNMPDFYYVARPWDAYRNNIRKVVIGDSITSIGPRAFYEYGIESIVGGENLTLIGNYAFYGCARLSSVPIWQELTDIGQYAFYGCSNLASITLGQKVRNLGDYVFAGTKITSMSFPRSVQGIGDNCFPDLEIVRIESLKGWCEMLFLDQLFLFKAKHVYIEGYETTDLVIPDEVSRIGGGAFYGCEWISSVTIGNGVTAIYDSAFRYTNISSLILGKNVKTIGYKVFSSCNQLKDVYVYAESVPSAWPDDDDDHDGTFQRTDLSAATLHVPASALEAYKTQLPWSKFGHIYAIGEEPNPQCATPTISFANGKIKFACETEDVEYVPTVTCTPSQTLTGDELELGTTYTVSVYAKREGYLDSEVATSTITLSTVGDVNGDGRLTIADVASLVNAILGK